MTGSGAADPARALGQALARALDRRFGPGHAVLNLARLSGGASRETWRFDARAPGAETQALILRRDPVDATGNDRLETAFGIDRADECRVQAAAGAVGVPVPEPVFIAEPADGLGAGYVMRRIAGETIPQRLLREPRFGPARAGLAAALGDIRARLDRVDAAALGDLPRRPVAAQLGQFRDLLAGFGDPRPGFAFGLRWLNRNRPSDRAPGLVHGDFRLGNLIVDEAGIAAVIDWELAHIGDPLADLGWLTLPAWRFGRRDKPVAGAGDLDQLLAAYGAAGGAPVAPADLRYWQAFGALRWGLMCLTMGYGHLAGRRRSVELAAIGRRAAETEYDLLELIDAGP